MSSATIANRNRQACAARADRTHARRALGREDGPDARSRGAGGRERNPIAVLFEGQRGGRKGRHLAGAGACHRDGEGAAAHGRAVYSNRDRAVGRSDGAIGDCINARDPSRSRWSPRLRRGRWWFRRRRPWHAIKKTCSLAWAIQDSPGASCLRIRAGKFPSVAIPAPRDRQNHQAHPGGTETVS